ncbi:MAG TPA: TonB-dependent receptor [Sphingomicrobium sp.]|nr:TonB-dependent receptor [Sphingomicrobium sp.]
MINWRTSIAALAAAIPLSATNAAADTSASGAGADPNPGHAETEHHRHDEEIVVTGIKRRAQDVLGGITVLDAGDLTREMRISIGETLARQPGVSSTSFGPAASAPVLRGLSGDRVRVLTDGIGTLDLSSSGPDHKVAINALIAERIEVLRGPAALLFGSSAIGGVVNVVDARIPRSLPENAVGIEALASYGSAADERSVNLALDVPLGGGFVAHADGNYSKSDDLKTGGHILSRELRAEALASGDPDIAALADLKDELPNSAARSREGAVGLGYVDGQLNAGLSVSRNESKYQVPVRYSIEPGGEAEAPTIDQRQTRYDARVEIPVGGPFEMVRARGGYAKYRHDELEDTGEIGSSFFSKGGEGRIEIVQAEKSGWGGTSGLQYLERSASIEGEEKFLPDSRQRQAGLFTLQTYVDGPLRLEAGARVESSRLKADEDAQLETAAQSRDFTTWSGSIGGQYEFSPGWRAGLSLTQSARAPSIDELFANGPHAASQSFEIGNTDLDPERSLGLEASLHRTAGRVHLTANAFYNRFSNFIFQAPTGETEDDLPVFAYRQGRANFYGFEVVADTRLGKAGGIDWGLELQADAVRGTVRNFGPAPLLPPFRLMGAVTGSRGQFDGRLEIERAAAHKRTAPVETPTPAYTLVNASFDWHPFADNPDLSLSLAANNIFDVVARRSTSVLKDYAPLAGRDIRVTARLGF